MEETLASQIMAEIDLLKILKKSSSIRNRILKVKGYILKEKCKEYLLNQFLSFSEKQEFLPFLGNLIIDH